MEGAPVALAAIQTQPAFTRVLIGQSRKTSSASCAQEPDRVALLLPKPHTVASPIFPRRPACGRGSIAPSHSLRW